MAIHEEIPLTEIEQKYFELFYQDSGIKEFENWVYESKVLVDKLTADDYNNLIGLKYREQKVRYDIRSILDHYVDLGKLEKHRLVRLIDKATVPDQTLRILELLYDLYCEGYGFLQDVGLGYGLACRSPGVLNIKAENWRDLNEKQIKSILQIFQPQLASDLARVRNWLISGLIQPTGERDELNRWEYTDNRGAADKLSTVWVDLPNPDDSEVKVSKNSVWERYKP